jgi:hypothetical protein
VNGYCVGRGFSSIPPVDAFHSSESTNRKSTDIMNYTPAITRDRPDAIPDPRKAFMTEEEHREFARSGATYAAWRSGAHC